MTLNISDKEMEYLEKVAAKHEMSKTAIIRHAIRLYELYDNGHATFKEIGPPKYIGEPIV